MNILYIEHYAGSTNMGMEFRPYYLSKEWAKKGHHVTIIAGDYSHLRKKNPVVTQDFQTENIDGIEYVWIKTGKYSGNGVKRALTMGRFVWKLMNHSKMIVKRWKPDLVIASSTYPLDTYPAQRIANIAKCKYVHEVHDMWPATLYEIGGMSRNHPFVRIMQVAEDSAYKHCDKCVALAPYSKDYMVQHGLLPDKFINVQNGVAEEEWIDYDTIPKEHEEFFRLNRNKYIVGYSGGHALSNALDLALDIAKVFLSIDSEIEFAFVGDGIEKARLVERAKQEQISNVCFLPPVSKSSVPDLLHHFDCSYMTGLPSPLYRFGLCLNKMYDSMMAGVPIVCAFDAPETLVSIYNCGIQCSPQNPTDVIKAIERIKSLTCEERKKMGERGKSAILEKYTYQKLADYFIEEIFK